MLLFLNGPISMSKPKQTAPSTIHMSKLAIGLLLLFSTAACAQTPANDHLDAMGLAGRDLEGEPRDYKGGKNEPVLNPRLP
jgi:hypothetical protein